MAKANMYNAKGSPAEASAKDEKDSFKRGGKKRKDGGAVEGKASGGRLDKRARGGAVGGSPFSSAKSGTMPAKQSSGKGSGHEDEQPGSVD